MGWGKVIGFALGLCGVLVAWSGCTGPDPVDDVGMLRADQQIEAYALRTGRLAPHAAAILQPYFTLLDFDVAAEVRVRVMPDWFGTFGLRGSPAAAGVLGDTLYVIPGVLDADGVWIRDNYWSWAQPVGIALWAHEVLHCWQYTNKLRYVEILVPGLVDSWLHGEMYSHRSILLEQEAIAFQHAVLQQLLSPDVPQHKD